MHGKKLKKYPINSTGFMSEGPYDNPKFASPQTPGMISPGVKLKPRSHYLGTGKYKNTRRGLSFSS